MEKIGKEKVRMQENTQAQFIHNQGFSLDWKIGYKSLFG
jgi:hypothetical protein